MPENTPRFDSDLDRELEELLADAEEKVTQLRTELAARRSLLTDEGGTPEEQHAEIAKLAQHLAEAKVHWGEVRAFFEEALREFLESRQGRGEPS